VLKDGWGLFLPGVWASSVSQLVNVSVRARTGAECAKCRIQVAEESEPVADRADLGLQEENLDQRLGDFVSQRASGHAFISIVDLRPGSGKLATEVERLARHFARQQPLAVR
jgi:hypothetical protein